jgi:hypothetical protein
LSHQRISRSEGKSFLGVTENFRITRKVKNEALE